MNSPARRFSLTKILAPQPETRAVPDPVGTESKPIPMAATQDTLLSDGVVPTAPQDALAAHPVPAAEPDERRHPKKKRSYSVDMGICDNLELIAWYQRRSSSSIVEELMRRYVANHREMLEKARSVHNTPKS